MNGILLGVAYLATVVEASEESDALLWLTVDGAFRVWVGNSLVAERVENFGGPIDREGYRVHLQPGPNLVLLKIASEDGFAGAYVRLTDSGFRPLPLAHGALPPTLDAVLPQQADTIERIEGPLDLVRAALDAPDSQLGSRAKAGDTRVMARSSKSARIGDQEGAGKLKTKPGTTASSMNSISFVSWLTPHKHSWRSRNCIAPGYDLNQTSA